VRPPRELSVPGLLRLLRLALLGARPLAAGAPARLLPEAPFAAARARAALARSLTAEGIAAEVPTSGRRPRSFERPYGLAWLLQLAAELREWDDPEAATLARPTLAAARAGRGRAPGRRVAAQAGLPDPDRRARQTAFAFGLMLDWARVAPATNRC
jgi:hypothetical protein